jgi:hypothetical protein
VIEPDRENTEPGSVVSRGSTEPEDDPEQYNATHQRPSLPQMPLAGRKKRPSIVERGSGKFAHDPERNHKTSTVPVPEPSNAVLPPESSEAEWEAPPGKMSREMSRPRLDERPAEDDEAPPADYQTGNEYQPLGAEDDEISMEGKSLEGDGLDALDPDLDLAHSKTRALPPDDDGADEAPLGEEGEGADEGNATNAGRPLKLEIIAGPDTGKKKKFRGVRLVIGRTPGVDLQLTDQSVSRRHVELIVGDGGVMLRDLGSGNGSKVNGEKVSEQALVHGDEILIGKTKIRFVDEVGAFNAAREKAEAQEAAGEEGKPAEGEAAKEGEGEADAKAEGAEGEENAGGEAKAEGEEGAEGEAKAEGEESASGADGQAPAKTHLDEEPAPGLLGMLKSMDPKKRLALFGGVAVLFFMVIVLAATRSKSPPPPDPLKTIAAEKMQAARDAVRSEKYEEAIALIEAAESLVPGIDQTRLATQARSELAVAGALDEARRLIDVKKFEDAKAVLAKAPQGSVKSEEAKKKLVEELASAEGGYRKQRFQEFIVQGEVEAAEQVMKDLPPPEQRDLAPVLEEAKVARAQALKEERRARDEADVEAKEHNKVAKAEAMQLAFAVVQRKFVGQEWSRAAAECDRVVEQNPGEDDVRKRSKLLQQLIPAFGRNYEEGMKKFRANQLAAAAKPLHKAYEQYQQIDFQTPMGDDIKEKLGQSALFSGKEALMREDLATAAMYFKEAAKLDPDEPKAKELLNDVIGRADDLYQGAYMIRDRDPREALKRFKVVVEITPSGSTIHEKAKNQISSMQP